MYRSLLRYDIAYDCRIGMGNFLLFGSCRMCGARIGNLNFMDIGYCEMQPGSEVLYLNKFLYVNELRVGLESSIGSKNTFTGGRPGKTPFKEQGNMLIGSHSILTRKHSFDLADTIIIGDDVVIGSGTDVWTHGYHLQRIQIQSSVTVGNHIYIGTRSLILPGVQIVDGVAIGAGTIVSKSIIESGFYVSSHLIRKSAVRDLTKDENIVEHRGGRFVRK